MGEPSLCPAGPAAPAQTSSLHVSVTSPSHGQVFRDELRKEALGNVSLSKPSAVVALVGAAACGCPGAMLEIQCRAMLDFFLSICCRQTAVMGAATSRAAFPKAQLSLDTSPTPLRALASQTGKMKKLCPIKYPFAAPRPELGMCSLGWEAADPGSWGDTAQGRALVTLQTDSC